MQWKCHKSMENDLCWHGRSMKTREFVISYFSKTLIFKVPWALRRLSWALKSKIVFPYFWLLGYLHRCLSLISKINRFCFVFSILSSLVCWQWWLVQSFFASTLSWSWQYFSSWLQSTLCWLRPFMLPFFCNMTTSTTMESKCSQPPSGTAFS